MEAQRVTALHRRTFTLRRYTVVRDPSRPIRHDAVSMLGRRDLSRVSRSLSRLHGLGRTAAGRSGAAGAASLGEVRGRNPSRVEIAVALALLYLAALMLKGYQFGVSDQNDELPLIRRALDPTYLNHDWFVNAATGPFDARRGYAWAMSWVVRMFGEPVAFWLVFSATIVALGLGIVILARSRHAGIGAGFAAALIVVANDQGSLGLSTVVLPLLVPSTIAWTLLVWAWVALERGRWVLFGLACGAAALVHPLIGSGGFGLLFLWSLVRAARTNRGDLAKALLVFAILASPSILPILAAQLGSGSSAGAEAVRIMTRLRGPWHYVPSTWPVEEWVGFGGFLTLGALAMRRGSDDDLARLGLLVLLMDLIAIVSVEIYPVPMIEKLQLFRLTVLVQIIGAIVVGRLVGELLEHRRVLEGSALTGLVIGATLLAPWLLVVACILVAVIRHGDRFHVDPRIARLVALAGLTVTAILAIGVRDFRIATALAVLLAGGWVIGARPSLRGRPQGSRAPSIALVTATMAMLVVAQLVAFGVVELPPRSNAFVAAVHEPIVYGGPLDDIALWAQRSTPSEAVFLVPPYDDSFRIRAGRAEVVDFKSFAFADQAILEWYARLVAVTGRALRLGDGFDAELRRAYDAQPVASLVAVARSYGATYVVVPIGALTAVDRPVYRNAAYAVVTTPP